MTTTSYEEVTLTDAIEIFLDDYDNANTRRAYSQDVLPLISHLGQQRLVHEIKPAELHRYVKKALKDSDKAPATIQKAIKGIKRFFNWCVQMEFISDSPARHIKQTRPETSKDHKAINENDLLAMLNYTRYFPKKNAMLLVLADTGCRAGGLVTMRLSKLDLENKMAYVTEKGNKTRKVWFGSECAHALNHWIRERKRLFPDCDLDYVFVHRAKASYSNYTTDALRTLLRRICETAGTSKVWGPHSFRHRKGCQLADEGVAPSVAAKILGHSDPAITLNYYYPKDDARAEAAIQLLTIGYEEELQEEEISPTNITSLRQIRKS